MKKEDLKENTMLHIRVPKELKEKLEKISDKTGFSVNMIVLNSVAEKYELNK